MIISEESSQRKCHQLEIGKFDLFGRNIKIREKKEEKSLLLLSLIT